jgi:hypothetical protein
MKKTVNSAGVHGEAGTGYEGPDEGPFRCSNCEYFNPTTDGCRGENMKKLSTREKLPSGDVLVQPGGVCVYFEGKGA